MRGMKRNSFFFCEHLNVTIVDIIHHKVLLSPKLVIIWFVYYWFRYISHIKRHNSYRETVSCELSHHFMCYTRICIDIPVPCDLCSAWFGARFWGHIKARAHRSLCGSCNDRVSIIVWTVRFSSSPCVQRLLDLKQLYKYVYSCIYRKVSNIRRTKSHYLNDSRLVLQLSLPNRLKPGVKSRKKMQLEQRRQAMLQLHLSDRQFYCLQRCVLY